MILKFASSEMAASVIENPALIASYGEKAGSRALQVFQRSEMLAGHARIYRMPLTAVQARRASLFDQRR